MRRFALLLVPVSAILTGCPIWDDDTYYYDDDYCEGHYDDYGDCTGGGSYKPSRCNRQSDCYAGEICSAAGYCTTDPCTSVGCAYGSECVVSGGVARCQSPNSSSSGGSSSGGPIEGKCRRSADCPVPGSRCVNNECIAPEQQCSDATQCRAGQRCVDGECTNNCQSDGDCPIGYGCDEAGLCTENPQPCSETQPCSDGAVCVGDRCVQECTGDDQCPEDLVCRFGGCVVDPTPDFYCAVTGELGDGSPGKCASGSICLRGSCYITCDPAAENSCRAADEFNQCKPVTTGGQSYSVCGSDTNLGNECSVADGNPCADPAKVCVDGYCL